MRPSFDSAMRHVHPWLLRGASLLVPWRQRAEWHREWQAELWHVRQACSREDGDPSAAEREVTAFCLGAYQDALCLRQECRQKGAPSVGIGGSARQCMLVLSGILVAAYAIAMLIPGVRGERSLARDRIRPDLVLIRTAASSNAWLPTISPAKFRMWKSARQRYFDGFAFYSVTQETVGATSNRAIWGVAHASANIFALLGLPVHFEGANVDASHLIPEIVLSEGIWKREFGADPHVTGSTLHLGQQTVRIAGVAPDGSLELPGNVDAWLLEPEPVTGDSDKGFLIGHLTALGSEEMWGGAIRIAASQSSESEDDLLGVAVGEWKPPAAALYLFAVFLAMLALPAITSVSLGESGPSPQKTSWTRRIYRWSFLAAKIGLHLPIDYFISLDLAYAWTGFGMESAVYIQLLSAFLIGLFGMRWILMDQRKRCPVCLRRVTHPAQVGQASRTFLAWNGTEMMCLGGHTLLHVPGLPTSWFGTQRWLYLDTSWDFLFADPGRLIP